MSSSMRRSLPTQSFLRNDFMSNLDFIAVAIKPCAKCGSFERNPKRECRACAVARSKTWRDNNVVRTKETSKKWYATNAKDQSEKSAARRAANPEQHKLYVAAWAKANKDVIKINNQNRRAKKLASKNKLSRGLIQKLYALQSGKCACCGLLLGNAYHLDHMFPLALGGSHTDENMQLLRSRCNLSKGAMHPIDYMQKKGFLL